MSEYNLKYLHSLIENKVEENLNLDYKASGSLDKQNNKTTEISKDVSAMANSDGGILIFGIQEDKVNKHLPEKIDPINRREFSKEWLEQIIQDKIRPRISNFKIYPIDIDNDNVVYVVEIKKSNTAHQASDKKYYKRFNFQSTAMYDYEIRDILNRNKNPELTIRFELTNQNKTLVVKAINVGSVFAQYVNVKLTIPKRVLKESHYNSIDENNFEIYVDNTIRDVLDVEFNGFNSTTKYGPSRYDPILPSQSFRLKEIEIDDQEAFYHYNNIKWEVFCDNSEPKKGEVRFQDLLNYRNENQ